MPRQRDLLNVRSQLERIIYFCDTVMDHKKRWGHITLPPAYEMELRGIALIAKATLRKRDATKTRKDLYVES